MLVERNMEGVTSPTVILLPIFGGGKVLVNGTRQERKEELIRDSGAFAKAALSLMAVMTVFAICCITCFNAAAQRQVGRIRLLFFTSVLRQDMTWFDTRETAAFASRITEDIDKIQEGIGEKLGMFIYLVSSFLLSVLVAFLYGWLLTLVVLTCSPIIIISSLLVARAHSRMAIREQEAYAHAGVAVEEALANIRTVMAFSGEQKEAERYEARLRIAEALARRRGIFSGLGGGIMWFIIYSSYGLAFWYGVELILQSRSDGSDTYTPNNLIVVLFGVLWGSMYMVFTGPHLEAFSVACGSAAGVFAVIERESRIDPLSTQGVEPPNPPNGRVQLQAVQFQYPSRPTQPILRGVDLEVMPGETVALVGASGSGKSTTVQLVLRLYDPAAGQVLLDGANIRELNVTWLRSYMGVVGQEPVLFATSIAENIRYGRESATMDEIEGAAREAYADTFIRRLPQGYNTILGEGGAQISGGQKQRIAIARALVRNPRILLLDEATSALDLRSEALVQRALDQAAKGRTTLIVAQRLSTVVNADRIVVFSEGRVMEQGSHRELMEVRGMYYALVTAETSGDNEEDFDAALAEALEQQEYEVPREYSLSILSDQSNIIYEIKSSRETYSHPTYRGILRRVMALNKPEWRLILVGCIAAILVGAAMPFFAVLFGDIYKSLSLNDPNEVRRKTRMYALLFLGLGVMAGVGTFLQMYTFATAGARLTARLRSSAFRALLRQEAAFFDDPRNGVGVLCSRLASDAAAVQGATGIRIASILQACSTLTLGVGLSMYYSWKLAMVTMLGVPIVFAGVFMEARLTERQRRQEKEAMEGTAKLAVEVISNIRTVAGLNCERLFLRRYEEELAKAMAAAHKKVRFRGLVFALGQTSWMIPYAITFYYGGSLVAYEGLSYENVIKVAESLLFGAWMLGQTLGMAPNPNEARLAAQRIFELLDRQPHLLTPKRPMDVPKKVEGRVDYGDVYFSYPMRANVRVLRGLHMSVPAGATVALVGHSGCGKSTCLQLLQRLYDPDAGTVLIEGLPTTEVPLQWLRAQLSIVSQEPVLFDRTIAQNIAYGDNARDVPLHEIVAAAKAANIHLFVNSLPDGYHTRLGTKGMQLSGGQKQRIAIARALVRNPRILLLDEATSALDTQSEKVVQKALDDAQEGRTCIIVAHRLATIRHASIIYVFKKGRVVEQGRHAELLAQRGLYYQMHLRDMVTK